MKDANKREEVEVTLKICEGDEKTEEEQTHKDELKTEEEQTNQDDTSKQRKDTITDEK